MENQIFNPKASRLEITLIAPIEAMEELGWDFDHYHNQVVEARGVSLEEAKAYHYENYEFYLDIEGTPNQPVMMYGWYNQEKNEWSEREETGDDEKTMEDIVSLLPSGDMYIRTDDSVDEDYRNVPGIILTEKAPN